MRAYAGRRRGRRSLSGRTVSARAAGLRFLPAWPRRCAGAARWSSVGAANAFSTAPARPGAGPPGPVESDDVGQGLEATNPYIIDGPVSEDTQFFGRERTLQWAAEILGGRATRRVLVVQGSYRIGKTSFLHHLQRRLQQTSFLVNLSTGQDDALAYLLWRAAVDIASIVRELTGRLFP